MPDLYDPNVTKYSTAGEDAKWTFAGAGVLAMIVGIVAGVSYLVVAALR